MRIWRVVLMALTGLALSAAIASANGGPFWRPHTVQPAKPAPVHVIPKASLPIPSYPWAQPVFRKVGGLMLPRVVATPSAHGVQPVWVSVGGVTLPKLP